MSARVAAESTKRSCSSPSARGRDWRYPITNRFREESVTL